MNRLALGVYCLSGLLSVLMCLAFPGQSSPVAGLWLVTMLVIGIPVDFWRRRAQPQQLQWVLNVISLHIAVCGLIGFVLAMLAYSLVPRLSQTVQNFCVFASAAVWLAMIIGIFLLYRQGKKSYSL